MPPRDGFGVQLQLIDAQKLRSKRLFVTRRPRQDAAAARYSRGRLLLPEGSPRSAPFQRSYQAPRTAISRDNPALDQRTPPTAAVTRCKLVRPKAAGGRQPQCPAQPAFLSVRSLGHFDRLRVARRSVPRNPVHANPVVQEFERPAGSWWARAAPTVQAGSHHMAWVRRTWWATACWSSLLGASVPS